MIDFFRIIFTIIATYIGAGFASGKEIYLYFFKYNVYGIWGIFISSVIIGYVVYVSAVITKKYKIKDFEDFINHVIKNKYLKKVFFYFTSLFFSMSFCVMVAGFCNLMEQELNVNKIISFFYIILICTYCYIKDIKAIMKINNIVVPFIIFIIIYTVIFNHSTNIQLDLISKKNTICDNFFISSILYSNYNLLGIIPINIAMVNFYKNKNSIKLSCIIISIIIFLLGFSIINILKMGNYDNWNQEIPIVSIVQNLKNSNKYSYFIIILFSIITTAISSGYSFLKNSQKKTKYYYKRIVLLFAISAILVPIGFSNLVKILYPIYGCVGTLFTFLIIKKA